MNFMDSPISVTIGVRLDLTTVMDLIEQLYLMFLTVFNLNF